MRFSIDYSRTFFDIQRTAAEQRQACEADFTGELTGLLTHLGASAGSAEGVAQQLWRRMVEPGRHYHTPVHVLSMWDWADRLGMTLSEAEALAVWFHDAVWQPRAEGDRNEQRSAAWLIEQARSLGLDPATAESAAEAIRWTARHEQEQVPTAYAQVLDLDLAGFAAAPPVFAEQSQAVRRELTAGPEGMDELTCARATVRLFEALLSRGRIYRSEPAQVLEVPARRQLGEEAARLKQRVAASAADRAS